MIDYKAGKWNISLIWQLQGSVFPRAFALATPAAILAAILCEVIKQVEPNTLWRPTDDELKNGMTLWSGYTFVLGFLLVFRTQQAYSRYWEGSTLLQEVRGEWFNATSSLFAFCTPKPERKKEVWVFQHLLVRLMSMLYCAALQTVYRDSQGQAPVRFEIIDPKGLDEKHLYFLDDTPEQIEVLVQWIQRLIVDNMGTGILPIPPPVITRAFQELSRGVVHLHNARKITDIAFPFPYAQMMTVLLLIHTCLVPLFAAILLPQAIWAALMTFLSVAIFWGINYIASEIEFPFGNDYNDLPMCGMTGDMNQSLTTLLDVRAQNPPTYTGPVDIIKPDTKLLKPASGEKTIFYDGVKKTRYSFASAGDGLRPPEKESPIEAKSNAIVPPAPQQVPRPTPEPKEQPKEAPKELPAVSDSLVQLGNRIEELMSKIVDKLEALVVKVGTDASCHSIASSVDVSMKQFRPKLDCIASQSHSSSSENISEKLLPVAIAAKSPAPHRSIKKKLKSMNSARSDTTPMASEREEKTEKPIPPPHQHNSIFSGSEDESETKGFLPSSSSALGTPQSKQDSQHVPKLPADVFGNRM